MITPIILSGGSGTRLWPLSRTHLAKQYLPLVTEKTLLQETALRLHNESLFHAPIVICNHEHRFLVAEQLREVNITPKHIVLETVSYNTAPAITIACLLQNDPSALLLVLPADHSIQNPEAFQKAIQEASLLAAQHKIITFGIKPNHPETGYGYIEAGKKIDENVEIFEVSQFIEKPPLEKAQILVKNNHIFWNSGIFLFKVETMLQEMKRLHPEITAGCETALQEAEKDLDFLRLNSNALPKNSSISIDYAVMEHTPFAAVMPIDMAWSDVGSWDALWKIASKTEDQNVLIGDVITHDVKNAYIRSENQLVSVLGLNDIIVVATHDAVFIADKNKTTEIKTILAKLKLNDRKELNTHKRVYRPWGYYQSIDLGDRFQVKRIMVKPHQKTSTQIHYHRSEHWVVVEGTAKVTRGDETFLVHENESVYLPMGIKHRVENPGKIPLRLIEVQSGAYLGEDDIVRIEDAYGRAANTVLTTDKEKV